MRFLSLLLILPLITAYQEHPFSSQPRYHLIDRALVQEIEQLRKDWGVKGAAIAVVRQGDDGLWKEDTFGVGVADGRGNAVTEKTLFSIASNSKLFTAFAAGLIVVNETLTRGPDARLKQTTKIKDVMPSWGLMDTIASEGTDLVDLLSHRTGLPRHDAFYGVSEEKHALISRMRHLRPSAEFRRSWQYNNLAYIVASTLPEHLYGIPFTRYVQDHILAPLGMNDTTYDGALASRSGQRSDSFARRGMDLSACEDDLEGAGFGTRCRGEVVNVGFLREGPMNAGPGGVITSARDMATWLKVLLLQGRSPSTNETIIPESIIAAAATPYTIPYQPPTFGPSADLISPKTYGMGQEMYTYRGHYVIEHGGAVTGQMSQVMRIPGARLGIAVMVNDNEFGTGFYQVVQRRVVDRLLGLEPVDWAGRVKAEIIRGLQKSLPPTRPTGASLPDIPLKSIPGTYVDEAYGEMVICAVDSSDASNLSHPSESCSDTLANNPFPPSEPTIPTFIARFDKFWSNYLLFTHRNGSVFTVTPSAFYPETNETLVSSFETYDAIFDGEGLAFTRNTWGAGAGVAARDPWSGGLKNGAEVWFEKK